MAWYEVSFTMKADDPPPFDVLDLLTWLRERLQAEFIMGGITLTKVDR